MNQPGRYRDVAVALDGTDLALEAIGPARRLARLHGAGLWLVTVAGGDDRNTGALLDAGLALAGGDARATVLTGGEPGEVLGRFDDDHPEVLLCLTTRGRRPLAKAVLGSVAAEVVRRSTEAVVLIGPSCDRTSDRPVGRLLVCLDGTEEGEAILPWATSWSSATGAALTVLHATYPLVDAEARVPPTAEQLDELAYLRGVVERLEADGHEVSDLHTPRAMVAEAIVQLAADLPGSVVAIATRSRDPLQQAVLGSITSEVLRASPAPLLVASRPR